MKKMKNLKILITGGAGFIPGSLAAKLAKDTSNFIVVVDNFLTGKFKFLSICFLNLSEGAT